MTSLSRGCGNARVPASGHDDASLSRVSIRFARGDDPVMSEAEKVWRELHLRQLGEFLKSQRCLNQLSQRRLAALANLSDTYMSQLERGQHEPSLSVLRALAEHLGIRPEMLVLYAAGLPLPTDGYSTEDAIRDDPRLTTEQSGVLIATLRNFVDGNGTSGKA